MRHVALTGLIAYFLVFTAGIPMVTFLCGPEDQLIVCTMPDCDAPTSPETHPTLSSPECCTPHVTSSEIVSAVVTDAGLSMHAIQTCAEGTLASPETESGRVARNTSSFKTLHTPLFLQHGSFLI